MALRRQVTERLSALQAGDWTGKAADAFYAEMTGSVLPSLDRLVRALAQAEQVSLCLSARLRQAIDHPEILRAISDNPRLLTLIAEGSPEAPCAVGRSY